MRQVRKRVMDRIKTVAQNIPLTKEFRMDIARVEIPVSGWTCFRTGENNQFDAF